MKRISYARCLPPIVAHGALHLWASPPESPKLPLDRLFAIVGSNIRVEPSLNTCKSPTREPGDYGDFFAAKQRKFVKRKFQESFCAHFATIDSPKTHQNRTLIAQALDIQQVAGAVLVARASYAALRVRR